MYNRFLRTLDQPIQLQPGKAYVVNDRTGEITEVPGVKGIEVTTEMVDEKPTDFSTWLKDYTDWVEGIYLGMRRSMLAFVEGLAPVILGVKAITRAGLRSSEIDARITDPGQRELAQALWREGASSVEAMSRVYTGKCTADWLVKTGRAELRRRVLEIRGW